MRKVWWLVVGVLLVVSIGQRHSLLFLMSLLLALVGGASYLWTRYCLAGVSYRRQFGSKRLFYGEETDLWLEIANAKPLPLAWLRCEDEFPAELSPVNIRSVYSHTAGRRHLINLLSLRWYERVSRRYRLRAQRRGTWVFGPVDIISGDIFGLDIKRERLPDTEIVVVYPKVVPLAALGLRARQPFGDHKVPRRLLEDPLRVSGTRDYQPGDSFRHIHWRASARQPVLQTKLFDPSASRCVAIFLNINTSQFIYEGLDRDLQEYAITAAASVARHACDEGAPVGLYVNSVTWPGGERIRIRPASHPHQLTRILEALARVVEYGRWPLEAVLMAEHKALRYGTTLVVITSVLNDHLRQVLADLRRREHTVTLIALGEARLEGALPGIQYYHIGGREEWHELESLQLA